MTPLFFDDPLSLFLLLRLLALLAAERIRCQFSIVSNRKQVVHFIAAKNYIFTIKSSHNLQIRVIGNVRALIKVIATFRAPNFVILFRKTLNNLVREVLREDIQLEGLHAFLIRFELRSNLVKISIIDL